jgi:hypothetical protein
MSDSIRMGIAFSIVGMSLLLGSPIEGALLRMHAADNEFLWFKSIVFCGVGLSFLSFFWSG